MDDIKKVLNITFLCGDKSGPHYHDIFVPSVFFHRYNLLHCESQFMLDYRQLASGEVLHFQRQYAAESYLIMKQLQANGKPCAFLCDDNVWELPPGNPARGTYEQADIQYRYEEIMRLANAVTTSTPYLGMKCRAFNKNVTIFRNLVDPDIRNFISPGRDKSGQIRIGWTGTPHHKDDAELIDEACLTIIQKYPRVIFVFMGFHPPNTHKYPIGRVEYYNFVPVDGWYPSLASLDLDIGLVPLIDHPFNWAKTCRKFQEYSVLGVPTIASNVGNYVDLPNDIVLKVKENLNPKSWVESMAQLVEDREDRITRGEKAYQYILDNHDINKYIHERAQFYYDLYAQFTGTERIIVWEKTQGKDAWNV